MLQTNRQKRHFHLRKKVVGTTSRPRLAVFRSAQHIYAQIIDDDKGVTLAAVSDLKLSGSKKEKSLEAGKILAKEALKKGVTEVVFDRGGFLYHGRIESLATGARQGGLKF